MKRPFRALAVATSVSTLVLIAWGGITRATGSGDGCPDWPRCHGDWIPRLDYHTLIEYTHRALGMLSGLLSLSLALVAIAMLVRARRGQALEWPRAAVWAAVSMAPLFVVQGALGGWVVLSGLDPAVVTIHFAVAFWVLALSVAITTIALADRPRAARAGGGVERLALWTAGATYALLLVGTYVRAEGAGLAFRDWPLMGGRLVPSLTVAGALEMFLHRGLALVVTALVIWLAVRARAVRPRSPRLVWLTGAAVALVFAQVVLGGLNVVTELATAPQAAHVGVSALIWTTLVAIVVIARREPATGAEPTLTPDLDTPAEPRTLSDTVAAYVALTKPRIIVLLLITTVPAMILAAAGMPSVWLVLATLLGGTLAAGSANAINMYLDRDIDQVMRRTRRRPIPNALVEPEAALRFGFILGAVSFAFLALVVNVLAAVLSLAAIAFYVFVYTMWLKRSTEQNIVIGGAAGAAPVLVAWAAVTGTLGWPAWVLFAIVFMWTPPHFWALAMNVRDDYEAARIPMMPVVRGDDETRLQIFLYSLVLFGVTLLLVPVASMGPVYLVTAVALGGVFVYRALRLWRTRADERSWALFRYSIVYLAALFGAVALDALVTPGGLTPS